MCVHTTECPRVVNRTKNGQIEKLTAKSVSYVTAKEIDEVHEYVDLGLPSGTLWATMNVGANSPEEFGGGIPLVKL